MVNIYLFLELLSSANAVATVDTLKALSLDNCKFANLVALSDEKLPRTPGRSPAERAREPGVELALIERENNAQNARFDHRCSGRRFRL